MTGRRDAAGNDDGLTKRAVRLYRLLQVVFPQQGVSAMANGTVIEVRIKKPRFDGDDALAMVKADDGTHKWIAFSGGYDGAESLRVLLERIQNGQISWREDRPYEPPVEESE